MSLNSYYQFTSFTFVLHNGRDDIGLGLLMLHALHLLNSPNFQPIQSCVLDNARQRDLKRKGILLHSLLVQSVLFPAYVAKMNPIAAKPVVEG